MNNNMRGSMARLVAAATVGTLVVVANSASAAIVITQTAAAAPTYATSLTFDEPGTPTGVITPGAFAGIGLAELQAGDGVPIVDDLTGNFPWVGPGNSFFGNFGVFATWSTDLTEFAAQVWDPSGPATPFGGGLGVLVFHNGAQVGGGFFTPAWGGLGQSWFNITTTDGSVFDDVRILGFGFGPTTIVDSLSWNAVPAPGALALLGLAFGRSARRRSRA